MTELLRELAAQPDRAGILLDFDGTLAPIVTRPEDVAPAPGTRELLMSLVARYRLVAVVSGRPSEDLVRYIGVDGIRYEGLYGLPLGGQADALLGPAESIARAVPGAWVEPKGSTVAVHYRLAEDPERAREVLAEELTRLGKESGYDLIEGKMVFELVPAGDPRKGGAVERLVREADLTAALYAGDDLPDLEAFAALDEIDGVRSLKIAVGGPEAPGALTAAADVVVHDPSDLIDLLRALT